MDSAIRDIFYPLLQTFYSNPLLLTMQTYRVYPQPRELRSGISNQMPKDGWDDW